MVKLKETYKTKSGTKVTIETKTTWDWGVIYRGSNNYDYNDKGEASFVIMFRGRKRSEQNDIIL